MMTSNTTDPRPAATEAAFPDPNYVASPEVKAISEAAWDYMLSDDAHILGSLDHVIATAIERQGLRLAAAPPSGRAACPTCGETGVDHDGFVCRDCDGQGSTPIAVPPSGQVCVSVEDLDYAIGDWNANKNLTERGEAIRDRLRAALKGASE